MKIMKSISLQEMQRTQGKSWGVGLSSYDKALQHTILIGPYKYMNRFFSVSFAPAAMKRGFDYV